MRNIDPQSWHMFLGLVGFGLMVFFMGAGLALAIWAED